MSDKHFDLNKVLMVSGVNPIVRALMQPVGPIETSED